MAQKYIWPILIKCTACTPCCASSNSCLIYFSDINHRIKSSRYKTLMVHNKVKYNSRAVKIMWCPLWISEKKKLFGTTQVQPCNWQKFISQLFYMAIHVISNQTIVSKTTTELLMFHDNLWSQRSNTSSSLHIIAFNYHIQLSLVCSPVNPMLAWWILWPAGIPKTLRTINSSYPFLY